MKKIHLLLLAGLSISLLAACQYQKSQQITANNTVSTQEEIATAQKLVTDYTLYNSVLKDYAEILNFKTRNFDSINKENINLIGLQAKQFHNMLSYTLYDFDKNGVDELMISMTTIKNEQLILDIRTIQDGKVIRVTNEENKLDLIGERMILWPLEDGSFAYRGASSATDHTFAHYRWNGTGNTIERDIEGTTPDVLDGLSPTFKIPTEEWYPVQWYITSPEKQKEVAKAKIDIKAIQNGDFSTLKGTWVNRLGHTLRFDENGLISDTEEIRTSHLKEINGYLSGGIQPKQVGAGSALVILPAGVPFVPDSPQYQNFKDPSQIDRDRLWGGHQITEQAEPFYYKIDD